MLFPVACRWYVGSTRIAASGISIIIVVILFLSIFTNRFICTPKHCKNSPVTNPVSRWRSHLPQHAAVMSLNTGFRNAHDRCSTTMNQLLDVLGFSLLASVESSWRTSPCPMLHYIHIFIYIIIFIYIYSCNNCPIQYVNLNGRMLGTKRYDQHSVISIHQDVRGHPFN